MPASPVLTGPPEARHAPRPVTAHPNTAANVTALSCGRFHLPGAVRGDLCVFRPCMAVLFLAVAAGQADGDVEASGGDSGGVHGAAVHRGDR
jgi:hypothetical protein